MQPTHRKPKIYVGQVARRHGVSRQTMASYIRAGCPAHDEEVAAEWIQQHRLQVEIGRFKPKGTK